MAAADRLLSLALLLAGAVACGGAGPGDEDAGPGRDGAAAEAGPGGGPDGGPGDTPAPVVICGSSADCGPDRFCSLPGGTCVSAVAGVAAGSVHTCAVHRDGRVSCWGYGPFIGPGLPQVTPPVPIELPGRAVEVAAGIQASCARLATGGVQCWGDLGGGPEAAGPVIKEDGAPLAGATRLAGGSAAFCAVHPGGTSCWGANGASELARPAALSFPPRTAVLARPGRAALLAATVAILVHDGASELCGWGNNDSGIVPGPRGTVDRPSCAGMIPGVLQLSAGDGHVCARRGGPAFSCWGSNSGGQLGNGDEGRLEVALPGERQELAADLVSIDSGAYHTCALLATGQVQCWGSNERGECGLPTSAPRYAPTGPVPFDAPVVAIGSGAGAQHTCGVLGDGSVHCWGYDNEGQLGSGVLTRDSDRASVRPLPVRW